MESKSKLGETGKEADLSYLIDLDEEEEDNSWGWDSPSSSGDSCCNSNNTKKGVDDKDCNNKSGVNWCGKFLLLFFILICASFTVTVINFDDPYDDSSDPPLVLENDRLPMISQDRKIIYVASEDGLPVAHNFILRNPSIPIEKIVFRKPGPNSTLHVYQIQRDALWATNHSSLTSSDIPAICSLLLMLVSIVTVMYIFTCKDYFGQVTDQSALDGLEEFYSLYFNSPMNSPMVSPCKHVPKAKPYAGKNAKELEPLLTV